MCTDRVNLSKEDNFIFHSKWKVLLLGDFNAIELVKVMKQTVISMFGEASCNSNGNLLIELLHNCD